MQHPAYEDLVRFASSGSFEDELKLAKAEFIEQTGELFESDPSFEQRIASFLEWYTMDRKVSTVANSTPAKLFIEHLQSGLTTPEILALRPLTRSTLSLFEIRRIKERHFKLVDILSNEKWDATSSKAFVGIEPGDIIQARLFPWENTQAISDNIIPTPKAPRKIIVKAAKEFRKNFYGYSKIQMVQRIAFLTNRSARYKHLSQKDIFADLSAA